jgi:hypothetical protein
MAWAQKQIGSPMEQNRRPGHKPAWTQPFDFWERSPKHALQKR